MGRGDLWHCVSTWKASARAALAASDCKMVSFEQVLHGDVLALLDIEESTDEVVSRFQVASAEEMIHPLISLPSDSSRLDAWKSGLSSDQQRLVAFIAGDYAEALGYGLPSRASLRIVARGFLLHIYRSSLYGVRRLWEYKHSPVEVIAHLRLRSRRYLGLDKNR